MKPQRLVILALFGLALLFLGWRWLASGPGGRDMLSGYVRENDLLTVGRKGEES